MISVSYVLGQETITSDNDTVGIEASKRVWQFGLMGGLIFSTVEGDNTESHSYIAGLGAGGYATMEIFLPTRAHDRAVLCRHGNRICKFVRHKVAIQLFGFAYYV